MAWAPGSPPAGSRDVHSVFDDVAAGTFNDFELLRSITE